MARVTDAQVREILTSAESSAISDLSTFINTANIFVDARLSESSYSDELLTEIEKYASAHFATLNRKQVISQKMDDIEFKYSNSTGVNLNSTPYGQMMQSLDIDGKLKASINFDIVNLGGATK